MKKKCAIEIHTLKQNLDESRNWKRVLDGLAEDGAKMGLIEGLKNREYRNKSLCVKEKKTRIIKI